MNPSSSATSIVSAARLFPVALALAILLVASYPLAASGQEGEVIREGGDISFSVEPNGSGVPIKWISDVVVSADLESFVVDVFVDDVLVFSELEPSWVGAPLSPSKPSQTVRVSIRDYEQVNVCDPDGAIAQLVNSRVVRAPGPFDLASPLDAESWSIEADTPAEVANVAAAGTFGATDPAFRIVDSDADAAIRITPTPEGFGEYESDDHVWHLLSGAPRGLPPTGERLVPVKAVDLGRTGGSVFISESEFGGRVSSVRLEAEILLSPLADSVGGYVLTVNERAVDSGHLDEDGRASISLTVPEEFWPRDATVALQLTLGEEDSPCSDDRPFYGQMLVEAVAVGKPTLPVTVSDFPAILLETSASIYVADDVADSDVSLVASALQASSLKRLIFQNESTLADADVVILNGGGSVSVDGQQLVIDLDEATRSLLAEEKFWTFTEDSEVVKSVPTAIESDDELVTVPMLKNPIERNASRIALVAFVALLTIAVLRLLWKNSQAAPEA